MKWALAQDTSQPAGANPAKDAANAAKTAFLNALVADYATALAAGATGPIVAGMRQEARRAASLLANGTMGGHAW